MEKELKAKILLVDDEEDFLSTLAERLELRGLDVDTAVSGEEALAKAEKEGFDLIVLDLAMPGMDGIETLKRIKGKQPEAEIIILTGQGSIKSSMEAMKLGAEDFMEKPVNISELLDRISDAKDKRSSILGKKGGKDIDKLLKPKDW